MAEKTTVSKNKTAAVGKYSYKYTDLAQIHEEMERQGLRYYQYIEPFQTIDPDRRDTWAFVDYVITVIMNTDGEELRTCRGCRVVDANGQNPTQEHGKAITYARRYSLLMALGWATDDDDAAGNIRTRPERKTQNTAPKCPRNAEFSKMINDAQRTEVEEALDDMKLTAAALHTRYGVSAVADLTEAQYKDFIESYRKFKEG